jgi:hypothetical protein|tara:strand:+ start:3017 stop:3397 length:381 start_codon:yes stop_codon:yes gene_type:complete
MQKRAGLLFLSKIEKRILLILEKEKWTVPTFARNKTLFDDSKQAMTDFSEGRILPIELYLSKDKGFEYSTYICLVDYEFMPTVVDTFCWATLDTLPKNIHNGLRNTLNNSLIRTKIETVLELENAS